MKILRPEIKSSAWCNLSCGLSTPLASLAAPKRDWAVSRGSDVQSGRWEDVLGSCRPVTPKVWEASGLAQGKLPGECGMSLGAKVSAPQRKTPLPPGEARGVRLEVVETS